MIRLNDLLRSQTTYPLEPKKSEHTSPASTYEREKGGAGGRGRESARRERGDNIDTNINPLFAIRAMDSRNDYRSDILMYSESTLTAETAGM